MEKLRDILLNGCLPSTDHGFTQCNWIWFNGLAITGSIDIYLCITKDEPLSLSSLLPLLTDHYWGWFRVGNNKVRSTQSNNGATKFRIPHWIECGRHSTSLSVLFFNCWLFVLRGNCKFFNAILMNYRHANKSEVQLTFPSSSLLSQFKGSSSGGGWVVHNGRNIVILIPWDMNCISSSLDDRLRVRRDAPFCCVNWLN